MGGNGRDIEGINEEGVGRCRASDDEEEAKAAADARVAIHRCGSKDAS